VKREYAMSDAKNENWQDLCRAIQEEKNHDKLNELASQLNAALDEWTKSKQAPNRNEQRGSKAPVPNTRLSIPTRRTALI
jgi:hypothetical protein